MNKLMRAELLKFRNNRTLVGSAVAVLLFVIVATSVVFLSATDGPVNPRERTQSVQSLSEAGGATAAFALGASFAGFFAFVVMIANIAGEFSQGTFRSLLMREPRRLRVLAGKMLGLGVFVAGALLVAEVLVVVASLAFAPFRDVSIGEWFTLAGLREAAEDYLIVLTGASAWAAYAMLLAVAVRSIPIGLGIGIAWAGPFEHLVGESWDSLASWFPGLLLEALAAGGLPYASAERALTLTLTYMAVAVAAGFTLFKRRDVTGG